jgi:dTMP kinase
VALLIAIEGIDGSGKGTQARLLHQRLERSGVRAALLAFPRYDDTLFGKAIGQFLNGKFGTLDAVHPFLAALLYAGDRFESRDVLQAALAEHEIVVLDRYVASNLAHQGAKRSDAERRELLALIEQIEYEIYRLPRPDLAVLLDVPVAQAQKLVASKSQRTYTDRKADLQEADALYLQKVREVYLELAAKSDDWYRLVSLRDGQLRSVDDIADELEHVVRERIKHPK